MEEADVTKGAGQNENGWRVRGPADNGHRRPVPAVSGSFARLLGKAAVLAFIGGLIGLGLNGARLGAGAAAGALVAGLYAAGYLNSHLKERERAFDSQMATGTFLRLSMVAVGGGLAWIAGRLVLIFYLASFAVAFALLVISEVPRVKRDLRARGLIGGGRAS